MTSREKFYADERAARATMNEASAITQAIFAVGRYLGAELERIGDELEKANKPLVVTEAAAEVPAEVRASWGIS